MALWTPYAGALDLSRTAVKEEPSAPIDLTDNPRHAISPADYGYLREHQETWQCNYQRSLPPLSPPLSPDLYDIESITEDKEYQEFERDALRAMAEKNGGSLLGNNPRMRRAVQAAAAQAADDGSYRQQRERNNFAAKQSRDRRKLREVRLAFQVTFLKKKLVALKSQLAGSCCVRCREQCQC